MDTKSQGEISEVLRGKPGGYDYGVDGGTLLPG